MIPEITDKAYDHPAVSILLLCLGWVLNAISGLTVEDAYVWTFRIASLTSVCMIIVINWKKTLDEIKTFKKKK